MKQMNLKPWSILGLALGVLLALPGLAIAAKGGIPGPPPGGEVGNNLSLPAVLTGSTQPTPHYWSLQGDPSLLGTHYSYGCDKPENVGQFNYPNTSCVDNPDDPLVYYDADACIAVGAPCEGLPVSRIYWQKVDDNQWSADEDGTSLPGDVAYVDWGDALEAVSWSERSVIRVETQPYSSTIPGFDPIVNYCGDPLFNPDRETTCKVGFQM